MPKSATIKLAASFRSLASCTVLRPYIHIN